MISRDQEVWIVTVGQRINSVWERQGAARSHAKRLIEVNGDNITVSIQCLEVRGPGYVALPNR